MAIIRNYAKAEAWTVADLVDASSMEPRGRRKITIPVYQRRLTWKWKQQKELINSIKKGFPIGALLMYRDSEPDEEYERYKLIDGLQRTQALRLYCLKPNSHVTKENIGDGFIDFIAENVSRVADNDLATEKAKAKILEITLQWAWERKGFAESDGWSEKEYVESLLLEAGEMAEDEFPLYQASKALLESESSIKPRVRSFLDSLQKLSDISQAEVPVIVYEGDSKYLPEIFKLLNTQGAKLSRYEVFAAQWNDYRKPIENHEIIDAVWRKYAEMEKEGYDLDVVREAPDESSRLTRNYTYFEYCFGLGQHLIESFPRLFAPTAVDMPPPAGFNLLSACLEQGVKIEDIAPLPERTHDLDMAALEARVFEAAEYVDHLMLPILGLRMADAKKTTYYHSLNQIISLIATAFVTRYHLSDDGRYEDIPDWEKARDKLSKNLPMYYLFDIFEENWRGSGDGRLQSMLQELTFLTPILRQRWDTLDLWHLNHLNNRQNVRTIVRDNYPEILLLRYIFVDKLAHTENYRVEHIIPTAKLRTPPSYYAGNEDPVPGPINTIGNLALIPADSDADFGEFLTFDKLLDARQRNPDPWGQDHYRDEYLHHCEDLLLCKVDILPSELSEQAFVSFLRKRFDLLKREFLSVWREHIPADPPS